VGRLDKETSGLLLLTDDGQALHRITSPKKSIWKVYRATLAAPLEGPAAEEAARLFGSGAMQLAGDRTPLLPARLTLTGPRTAEVSLCEGRYHQVRRMFAALGHEVVGLHRHTIGGLSLSGVPEGEWRFATAEDFAAVFVEADAAAAEAAAEAEARRLSRRRHARAMGGRIVAMPAAGAMPAASASGSDDDDGGEGEEEDVEALLAARSSGGGGGSRSGGDSSEEAQPLFRDSVRAKRRREGLRAGGAAGR
jgi:pseudouridine synthase